MTVKKKIYLAIGLLGLTIGGYALTKYLTRNVRRYKYVKLILTETKEPILDSEGVE